MMASMSDDSSRITKLLKETVVLLCENSVSFASELSVQGLLGITVDRSTIYLVQVDEKLAKNRDSVAAGAGTGGSRGTQGQAVSESRPVAARRLALPAPPASSVPAARPSSGDGAALAWPLQSSPAAQPVRARGPRFPVGRGRGGMLRGGRGRGGATVRGGAAPVRMIRTAVSSVRFPVSQSRMQAPQRALRPAGVVHSPFQRLALPPPTAGSTAARPNQVPAAAVRQRAPVPAVRKASPRLALMPPPPQSAGNGSPRSGPRQLSPAALLRQAGPPRAAVPRGVGRLPARLAIMSPPRQRQPSANSQSAMLRSPTPQPRAVPPRLSPRLALMPPPQSPVKSPGSGTRHQTSSTTLRQSSPSGALSNMQLVVRQPSPRHLSPGAANQASSQGMNLQLARLASQLSSSSVGTQLRSMVEQLSKQQGHAVPGHQSTLTKPHTVVQTTYSASPTVAKPRAAIPMNVNQSGDPRAGSSIVPGTQSPKTASQPVHHTAQLPLHPFLNVITQPAIQPTHSAATAARPQAVVPKNINQTGYAVASSGITAGTQSPRTSSHPVPNTAPLPNQILSLIQSSPRPVAVPTLVAVTQQTALVIKSSPASNTSVTMSRQPVSIGSPVQQPFMMMHLLSDNQATPPNIAAQNSGVTGIHRSEVQNLGTAPTPQAPQSNATMNAFLLSPHQLQFSPVRPASTQQLTAMPLYATPTKPATVVPPSPPQRADTYDLIQWRPSGTPQKNVMVAKSSFGLDLHAGGGDGPMTGMQPTATLSTNQLVLSPQPRHPQSSVSHLQQCVNIMPQFSPQQQQRTTVPSSPATQMYLRPPPPSVVDGMNRDVQQFSSPVRSHISSALLQQRTDNASVALSPTHSQTSITNIQRQQMSQTAQPVMSGAQGQTSLAALPLPTSVRSHISTLLQQQIDNVSGALSPTHSQTCVTNVQHQQMSQTVQPVMLEAQGQTSVTSVQQTQIRTPTTSLPMHVAAAMAPIQHVVHNPQQILPRVRQQKFPSYEPKSSQSAERLSAAAAATAAVQQRSQNHQGESPIHNEMQKNTASVQQQVPHHQQVVTLTPSQVSAAHVQYGHPPRLEAALHVPSSQKLGSEVSSQKPHSVTSVPREVVQAAMRSGAVRDRQAVLEIIKHQAYDQLRKGKEVGSAQHRTTASGVEEVAASASMPVLPAVTGGPQQTVMQSSSRSSLSTSEHSLHSGIVTSPAGPHQPQSKPQQLVTSSHLKSASPSFARQTPPGVASSSYLQTTSPSVAQQSNQMACSVENTTVAISTPTSPWLIPSVNDNTISVGSSSSSSSPDNAPSISANAQHNTSCTKEQLMQLRDKIEKKGLAERNIQKIISAQPPRLLRDISADEETTDTDVQPSSSNISVVQSAGNASVTRSFALGM